ncbi:type VII secretion system (T7SS), usher family protein, partial [Klebsiella pneumoniae]|nr:type VII secretion system (T7SS), usher family protein [Klebsiella pneumoniae]
KIGPDPRNFNQRVSLGRNDLLIRTFLSSASIFTFKTTVVIATLPVQ